MIEEGYKVCRIVDGKPHSLTVGNPDGEVWYEFGNWVIPRKDAGPLAVFDTLCHAELFMNEHGINDRSDIVMFGCEYVPARKKIEAGSLWFHFNGVDFYSKTGYSWRKHQYCGPIHEGTRLAWKVKLDPSGICKIQKT